MFFHNSKSDHRQLSYHDVKNWDFSPEMTSSRICMELYLNFDPKTFTPQFRKRSCVDKIVDSLIATELICADCEL